MSLRWSVAKWSEVFGAMLVAAADESVDRPQFCCVRVTREGTCVTVAATDGHWVLRWQEHEPTSDENGVVIDREPFAVSIPRRAIESFLGALKHPLMLEQVLLEADDGATWCLSTMLDVRRHLFLQVPEVFPDLRGVIPRTVSPRGGAVAMGAGLLAKVAKAFAKATGRKDAPVLLQMAGDALSPLVATTSAQAELLAVVMPLRDEATNALPTVASGAEAVADAVSRRTAAERPGDARLPPDVARAVRQIRSNPGGIVTSGLVGETPVDITLPEDIDVRSGQQKSMFTHTILPDEEPATTGGGDRTVTFDAPASARLREGKKKKKGKH